MKKQFKRGICGLLAMLVCFTTILGGGVTAFAASSSGEVAKSYSIGFPRSGDANLDYNGSWGHDELHYMNGWYSGGETWMTTLHTIGSFDGPACYCIEPGVPRLLEKEYTRHGEDYWKNYPSDRNSTIDADTIKTLLGRIMQYGYQGNLSLDWRSQNAADADKMAHMMATQVLVWETVVGERDANFNHVDPGSCDAVKSIYRTSHPLYSRFLAYYDSIEASVKSHTVIPSFMSKTPNKAQTVELTWDGSQYTATLTDSNHVVSDYTFTSNLSGVTFTTNGDTLTITAKTAPTEPVTISASKNNIRKGVVVWSDGHYGPDGTMQDVVTYAATVMDPVQAFLNLKVSYGSAKIVKTSEDGKVDNLTFTVTGNGINQTVKTNSKGEIQIDNLMPGVYTVTEMDYDKYEPQESRRVTVVSGQVSTVTFNNKLKRGDLQIVKSSEDNLNEGVTFHLYGTSLSGIAVDEYAVTDENGVATFEDVLISGSTPYTVEEVDTAVRYVVPEAQSAPIRWNEVTNRSFLNILKKFTVTVTKSDTETGTAQGDASLAGAVYGIYKGETLVDTYTTDKNGQFVTKEYICDDDWTVREITPSEGYLLDTTVHKVGSEPQLYTVEHNQTANDVTEQVAKGNIAIIKHTDNGDTQIETPENGAEFAVYLKAAGSYDSAKASERDYLTCDENGFAQTKDMPYGIYTVHQVSGWEGSELMPDFDVFISQNGATYRYLINNAPFNSFIKIVKQDAETGKTIPYAGAGFKIYDPDGNPVTMTFTYPTPTTIDVFYTNADGFLVTPEKLPYGKGYSIVEVQAPYGYVLDETPVYFDVTEDNSTEESGVTVVKVEKPNMAQKGTIIVEKTGEVFFGVSVIGGVDESGNELPTIYQPQYEKRGLPGAVYEIIAAEDIITPDGTARAQKGEVVDTVTTDENGTAVSRELYLGKYEVREITAPHGMVLNPEPHCVELVYGSKCPYCSGIKLLKGFNDLASLHPQLALEWSQNNGTLLPEDFNERSTKNVWWKCSTCGHEYRAVIKSKVHGLKCPVCTKNALLPGYNDLATTDPELAQEWNAAKNTRKPTEISRLSQYPVWWKGICGHEWKDKVFHRAVEGAGCIYCEKAFLKELPYLLVTMYAKQYGLATRTDDEKLIGARIDAVIPELRLAFAFSQKDTDREAKVAEVLHFLCKAKRIQLFVIRQKDPIALATEIKQAFAKANLFINSDSQTDVVYLRKRYFAQKINGN